MSDESDESLINKVANKISQPPPAGSDGVTGSILTVAASSYGSRPVDDDITRPTGFDPDAAALFESVVEAAYLVANADGVIDATERNTFKNVVLSACEGAVAEQQIEALLADLTDLLQEDGIDKRVQMVTKTVKKPEHAREVLRVAALLAQVSGGVSDIERDVLQKLTAAFGLDDAALQDALAEAERTRSEA